MKEYKITTKSNWNLNCKEATFLTELSKEGKLNLSLNIRLWYHMTLCPPCKQFQKQTLLLAKRMKEIGKKSSPNFHHLSDSEKQELQEQIEKKLP